VDQCNSHLGAMWIEMYIGMHLVWAMGESITCIVEDSAVGTIHCLLMVCIKKQVLLITTDRRRLLSCTNALLTHFEETAIWWPVFVEG